ncbi:MAG: methyltransferase [Sneathiella sp.]
MQWTIDGFLDGKLKIKQPAKGFRAGSDAVLLAASVEIVAGQSLLDVGCGVGTAALCVKHREPNCTVFGLEYQSELAKAARENIQLNEMTGDFTVLDANIANRLAFKGAIGPTGRNFLEDPFDHVITNPPFYAEGRAQSSPSDIRTKAHIESDADLDCWIKFCTARLKPKGTLSVIYRTERLSDLMAHMCASCGSLKIIPLWPNAETSAKRVIVQGIKGGKGPLELLPGLILHEKDGKPTAIAEKLLRDGVDLSTIDN